MPANTTDTEKRLWDAADELRANSKLKASEYSVPVLGLIFLKFADAKFERAFQELAAQGNDAQSEKLEYQARGVMYVPDGAWFANLLKLPESADRGKAINDAMRAIESENPRLKDVLPKTYNRLENRLLVELLRTFDAVPMDVEGDLFGKIYEYFLGKFAMTEGQKGGEFFTPTSVVKLIVEVIEPFRGLIYDPASGSGGMFVQSARFVQQHQGKPFQAISIYGLEKTAETIRLAQMNLGVHGLEGDIRQANSYYDDPFHGSDKFDFVMANPPFNVDKVQKDTLKDDKARFPFGMPTIDNANYLWIQLFYSALNEHGRAGFVMANSASDARGSELAIRQQLIQAGAVDVMIAVGSNFFYTVTLPCTLWFFDRGKRGTPREDTVLFLDARQMFRQVDRAHREFKSGDVNKEELRERFPLLENIPNLLVTSPIDDKQWDWNAEYQDAESFKAQLTPALESLQARARQVVEHFYSAVRYESAAAKFLNGNLPELRAVTIALARQAALGALEALEISGDGLGEQEIKAATREYNRFKKLCETIPADADAREKFFQEQTDEFNTSGQRHLLELLLEQGLLFDHARSTLPLDENDFAASVETIFHQDLAQCIDLWQKTRHTNHLKILRDIVRAYRGEEGAPPYQDIAGLCKVATRKEIEAQGWSLNPGRYVGVAAQAADDFDFRGRLEELNEELEGLNAEAHDLEERIAENVIDMLEGTNF